MVDCELAKFKFGPGAKEFARIPKIDAPPYPKVAQFFKEKATTRAEAPKDRQKLL